MTKIRYVAVIAIVGLFAILGAGYYFVLSPQKASAAKVHTNLTTQQAANGNLQIQLARLKKEETQVPIEQARIAAIGQRVPTSPEMPSYVRFLNSAALKAHVELVSVAPGAPAPVTLLAPPVTAPAPTTPAAGSKTSAAPAPAAPAAPTTSALSAINVTMNIVGGYFAVQQFLTSLEASTRATVVTSVTMLPGVVPQPANAKGQSTAVSYKTLQTTVVATIYLSNTPPASATTVVPAAPGPASTASASPAPSTATNS
jgi:hypothetical protein